MRGERQSISCALFLLIGVSPVVAAAAPPQIARVPVQVDTLNRLYPYKGVGRSGHTSRFAVSPRGEVAFLYTNRGNIYWPTFLQYGRVGQDGRIRREALANSSPRPLSHAWPFDIAYACAGDLRIVAARTDRNSTRTSSIGRAL